MKLFLFTNFKTKLLIFMLGLLGFTLPATAELAYYIEKLNRGEKLIFIEGQFSHDDNLQQFQNLIIQHQPIAVTFNSHGGSVSKSLELGRMIRQYGLNTIQLRSSACESACAYAFFGGIIRNAEPGSIGVHQTTYANNDMSKDEAVNNIQRMSGILIEYMQEMGIDPALLKIIFQYDGDDIRYLSKSEMERYKVIQSYNNQPEAKKAPPKKPQSSIATSYLPYPKNGRIRHPKKRVYLKSSPNLKSQNLLKLFNGEPVIITDVTKRWYKVNFKGYQGYLHHNWVFINQFDQIPFENRRIQIKSFNNLYDAKQYVRGYEDYYGVYATMNGWYAIAFTYSYPLEKAIAFTKSFKNKSYIPRDSFVTFGNTYIKKVCCN